MTRTRLFVGLETSTHNTHIHPEEVKEVISEHVDAGTFYQTEGLWMGGFESSLVFECMGLEDSFRGDSDLVAGPGGEDRDVIEALKTLLEEEFDQDSVMVEQTDVEVAF